MPALSALPAHSPAFPSVPIQILDVVELCKLAITDSYQTISKTDTVAASMYAGIIPTMPLYGGAFPHPLPIMYDQHAHADDCVAFYSIDVDTYIDLGLEPVKTAVACEPYSYYQNMPDATPYYPTTSQRRASTSSGSSVLSPPRLSSPSWRESSNSPSSMLDCEELQTPSIECFDGANIANRRDVYVFPNVGAGDAYTSVMSATTSHMEPQWEYAKSFPKPVYGADFASTSTLEPTPPLAAWLEHCAAATADGYSLLPPVQAQPCVSALPPSAFVHTQPAVPAAMPVLQHPRPRHAYIPDWQTATEFDMKQFVKDASSPAPPDAPQPPRYPYDAAAAPLAAPSFSADAEEEGIEEDEMEEEYDEDDEMEEGWEEDDDAGSDQGIEVDETELYQERHSQGPAAPEISVGPGMGLGYGTRTLDANCLLFQPVADYVRCPDAANFAMPSSYTFAF